MVVSGRAELAQQEVPLMRDIAGMANEISTIQASLKHRVEAREKYVLCTLL